MFRKPEREKTGAAAVPQPTQSLTGQTGQATGQIEQTFAVDPMSATSGMDAVASMLTSPIDEDKKRRASMANQRILALGDALRHVGNIYHTVKGAPSQQFNNPVMEEQARYEKGKAVRDAANLKYNTYLQQRAAQDAKKQQLDASLDLKLRQLAFQQDKFNKQQSLNELKEKNNAWYRQATIEQKEAYLEIQRQLAEGRISLMEAQRKLNDVKARQGGFAPSRSSGSSVGGWEQTREEIVTERDAMGKPVTKKVVTTKTPKGTYDQQNQHKKNPYGAGDKPRQQKNNHKKNPYN